ncbi:hypothetical protein E2C01_078983 [Portunus trituberculatus]|uniref:Uncharacterized protein n=1 Tax=Portunus trituberculatus TaxID=210409 RepID=A0A5B7IKA0_PORTR|nr:hypothetical protein [Portunus trituberculatus]
MSPSFSPPLCFPFVLTSPSLCLYTSLLFLHLYILTLSASLPHSIPLPSNGRDELTLAHLYLSRRHDHLSDRQKNLPHAVPDSQVCLVAVRTGAAFLFSRYSPHCLVMSVSSFVSMAEVCLR